jgi:hypothetical protein
MSTISRAFETIVPDPKPTAKDFNKANFHGFLRRWIDALTGRSTILLDIDTIVRGRNIRNRSYSGTISIRIDQIKGSEGRCQEFDQDFNPLKLQNRERWLSIARAWYQGISLPAIELIKIQDVYIVRDGHHRISVARYMGSDFIDARVTEWVLED